MIHLLPQNFFLYTYIYTNAGPERVNNHISQFMFRIVQRWMANCTGRVLTCLTQSGYTYRVSLSAYSGGRGRGDAQVTWPSLQNLNKKEGKSGRRGENWKICDLFSYFQAFLEPLGHRYRNVLSTRYIFQKRKYKNVKY